MDEMNQRLKAIRIALGKTQKDFSEMLSVKRPYYSELEGGKRLLSAKIMRQLVENQNVSANYLLSGKGEMFSNSDVSINGGESPKISDKNSLFSDTELWGKVMGEAMGEKKGEHLSINYTHRLFRDLKKTDSKSYDYLKKLLFLSDFHDFIGEFENTYLDEIRKLLFYQSIQTPGNKIPYRQYKENIQKALKKIEEYKPILYKLDLAVRQFYQDFQPFDTKNIIEDYFDASED